MSSTPLVSGMLLGGIVIASLGAGSTYFLEEKNPSFKTVGRDFIIGAAMLAMILQLLPESSTSLIQYILQLAPLSLMSNVQSGGQDDMEVKVGVPKF
jgi:hypothetical protein